MNIIRKIFNFLFKRNKTDTNEVSLIPFGEQKLTVNLLSNVFEEQINDILGKNKNVWKT